MELSTNLIGGILTLVLMLFTLWLMYKSAKNADEDMPAGLYWVQSFIREEVTILMMVLIFLTLIEGTIVALIGAEHQVNVIARFFLHTFINMLGTYCMVTAPRKFSETIKHYLRFFYLLFTDRKKIGLDAVITLFKMTIFTTATVGVSILLPIGNVVVAANYLGEMHLLFEGLANIEYLFTGYPEFMLDETCTCLSYHPLAFSVDGCGPLWRTVDPMIYAMLVAVFFHFIISLLEGLGVDASIKVGDVLNPWEVGKTSTKDSKTKGPKLEDIKNNTEKFIKVLLNRIKDSNKTITSDQIHEAYVAASKNLSNNSSKDKILANIHLLCAEIERFDKDEKPKYTDKAELARESRKLRQKIWNFFRKGPSKGGLGYSPDTKLFKV